MSSTTYIILNGLPGVGKLSVATELCRLLPNARLFNNHRLIDVVASLYERDDPAYQPLRHALRQAIFKSLEELPAPITDEFIRPQFIIFTEFQSTSLGGPSVMNEYLESSRRADFVLISVIIDCDEAENERRLMERAAVLLSHASGRPTAQLVDVEILREVRRAAGEMFRYGNDATLEMVIDTSKVTVADAASRIMRGVDLMANPGQ